MLSFQRQNLIISLVCDPIAINRHSGAIIYLIFQILNLTLHLEDGVLSEALRKKPLIYLTSKMKKMKLTQSLSFEY